jgi:hypothetical protein
MILHAASIAAFFVDRLAQAPVQIQCVQQSTPESWVKWLLPTIVQTVISLLSIFAGVAIAVRSFQANRKTEHEQWVRDQKKAEWKEIVEALNKCRMYLPQVYHQHSFDQESVALLGFDPESEARELESLFNSRLFINSDLSLSGIDKAWEEIRKNAKDCEPIYSYGIVAGYNLQGYSEAFDRLMQMILSTVESSLTLASGRSI